MDFNTTVLFIVILFTMILFMLEIFALEVTALISVTILLLFDIIKIDEIFLGFSNSAVITIACMFIISRALEKTGFLEVFADKMYSKFSHRKWLSIFLFLITVSVISGFINNTAAVAIFIPLAINLCQKFHISPSKLLIPLSYAAIFGGTLTLIGTSTNLVVNSFILELSNLPEFNVGNRIVEPFGMFEFTKLGLIFMGIGLLYNFVIIKWFIPSRAPVISLTQKYHMRTYLTEFKIPEESVLAGQSLEDVEAFKKYDLQVFKIIRNKVRHRVNLKIKKLEVGDIVLAQINLKDFMKFRDEMKVLLLSDVKMNQQELAGENHVLIEGLVPYNSSLIGSTIKGLDFRNKFSGFIMAIKRQTELLRTKISQVKLKFSDTLLILIPKDKLQAVQDSNELIILEELKIALKYGRYWWLPILVLPLIMISASFGIYSISAAAFLGVAILIVFNTISINEAYESMDLSVIFLISFLIPIGIALQNTNAADVLINLIIVFAEFINNTFIESANVNYPITYLSILYFFTFFLSAFLSNAAVAVVLTPIAIALSVELGVNHEPFLMAICFGASASFMTPMGYQTNMMVFAPGQYRFSDFVLLGLPLTIIFWIVAIIFIPKFWSFSI